jgi:hypothetical protein
MRQLEILREAAIILERAGFISCKTRDEQLALLKPPYNQWQGPRLEVLPAKPEPGAEFELAVNPPSVAPRTGPWPRVRRHQHNPKPRDHRKYSRKQKPELLKPDYFNRV